jgi:DNA-binding NtrC family response regulator
MGRALVLDKDNELAMSPLSKQHGNSMSKPAYQLAGDTHDESPPVTTAIEALKSVILKSVAHALLQEAEPLGRHNHSLAERPLHFYDEVRRFEINLIERALLQTGGRQNWAAPLLGMKASTLNTKVKVYNIAVSRFSHGPPNEPAVDLISQNQVAAEASGD